MERITHHAALRLSSSLACVDAVEHLARSFALLAGFDENVATDVALATREATVNAIVHGNQGVPEKVIWTELDLTADALWIRVSDEGEGFQPDEVADPLLEANLLRSSGRGVFLIRKIMDEVHLSRSEKGSTVTLLKRRG